MAGPRGGKAISACLVGIALTSARALRRGRSGPGSAVFWSEMAARGHDSRAGSSQPPLPFSSSDATKARQLFLGMCASQLVPPLIARDLIRILERATVGLSAVLLLLLHHRCSWRHTGYVPQTMLSNQASIHSIMACPSALTHTLGIAHGLAFRVLLPTVTHALHQRLPCISARLAGGTFLPALRAPDSPIAIA